MCNQTQVLGESFPPKSLFLSLIISNFRTCERVCPQGIHALQIYNVRSDVLIFIFVKPMLRMQSIQSSLQGTHVAV